MPIVINVQRISSNEKPQGNAASNVSSGDISAKLVVIEARKAAMRSLLHDFSNVMVGLCSISENAVDEIEPGSLLRDDMEIIRDSALKARQIIRRISVLNGSDEDEDVSLVDLVNWIEGEIETIKAVLPKGSVVSVPDKVRTVLSNVSTSNLRDFLITLAAGVSGNAGQYRIKMEIEIRENDDGCAIVVVVADAYEPKNALSYPDEMISTLGRIAEKLEAAFSFEKKTSGPIGARLVLRCSQTA